MINIGIVGAGGMGSVHYHNYLHIEGCRAAAIVGLSEQDKMKAEEWGLPLYPDIASMTASEDIDVVDVCTPTFLHLQNAMEGIAAGKHIIVEKPMALHRADAERMFASAKAKGVLLLVGQVLRFSREVEVLRELVEKETYGRVLDASFERLSACPRWAQGGWLFDKDRSGQLPFDLHIHDLDIIVSLFGRPDSYSYTYCGRQEIDYKEQYRFSYRFGKVNISAEAAWFNADIPFTARWRVYFENAVVVNDGVLVTAYQFDQKPLVFDTEDKMKIPTGINVPPTGIYLSELSHFMDCIRKGEPSSLVREEELLTVVEILETISRESE